MNRIVFGILAIIAFSLPMYTTAQTDSLQLQVEEIENSLNYETGTILFPSCNAKLTVPKGFRYLNTQQSVYVLSTLWGNPADSSILGLLVPENRGVLAPNSWVFTISFDEMGYVKDDDAEDIDYNELLESMQKETNDANAHRVSLGYPAIAFTGWASKPFYDKTRKVLHWAKELKFGNDSLNTLNYNLRILGKDGVFIVNAVASMSELPEVKPSINKILASVQFEPGYTYADFDPKTDNVAAWSIGGLVAGKVLAKVGFFAVIAKFGKLIILGLIAAGGFVWNFIRGRKKEENNNKALEKPTGEQPSIEK